MIVNAILTYHRAVAVDIRARFDDATRFTRGQRHRVEMLARFNRLWSLRKIVEQFAPVLSTFADHYFTS